MRILITAGPSWEPIDRVRRLTNFSTGTLGTALAREAARRGHQVVLMRGEAATCREHPRDVELVEFGGSAELGRQLELHQGTVFHAVWHAAAVADFRPGGLFAGEPGSGLRPVEAGKVASREGPLWLRLDPAPKLIEKLRDWFPRAWLAGWKYEVEGGRERLLGLAREQLVRCRTDACVVNGPAWGEGFGVVTREGAVEPCSDAGELAGVLLRLATGAGS
ncbi:MAG: DNA/pantothenate metabolism flavoprotein domain protein [Verrucomicrobia bacterium]|nr:MAG: DNA/pantothenate metabolism flavoprotein domain protein [Verrucomicrobiota bacterium]